MINDPGYSMKEPDMWCLPIVQTTERKQLACPLRKIAFFNYKLLNNFDPLLVYFKERTSLKRLTTPYLALVALAGRIFRT